MRKLALDLGTRTCGFAITDDNNIIVTGLENFRFEENNFQAVIEKINDYIKQYKTIDTLVLGHPLRSNGTKSERTEMVENFKKILEDQFNLNVVLVNEHGSTIAAESILIEAGFKRKKRKGVKDKLAAQLILEDYLNYHFKK
ncbi:Holliday junction resolvase RuvX [Mycoplasma zalophi]|uniref:Putative pre-16S rRNA nuclease n=1 Tax=Mycoplasma zalophi TaxID=191287 RepID=A0ABS6DRL6_9MOLU|nr:Holliday junction resolvase RuvX [Mycoplasma zalophi]MBU4690773.1 Holliday junction resolvase RuvX [Mycoplasma zalophi]MBU4692411.1 Holliday junction resolvase RuvX [Mycoplasma zalophi]